MNSFDDPVLTAEMVKQITQAMPANPKPVLREKVMEFQRATELPPWVILLGGILGGLSGAKPLPRREFIPRHSYAVKEAEKHRRRREKRDLCEYGISRTSYRHGVLKNIMNNVRDTVSCLTCGALPGEPCRAIKGPKIGSEKFYCHKYRVLQAKVAKGLAVT